MMKKILLMCAFAAQAKWNVPLACSDGSGSYKMLDYNMISQDAMAVSDSYDPTAMPNVMPHVIETVKSATLKEGWNQV